VAGAGHGELAGVTRECSEQGRRAISVARNTKYVADGTSFAGTGRSGFNGQARNSTAYLLRMAMVTAETRRSGYASLIARWRSY
jgi:hypothetical protein